MEVCFSERTNRICGVLAGVVTRKKDYDVFGMVFLILQNYFDSFIQEVYSGDVPYVEV
jgi:hypothetical protein